MEELILTVLEELIKLIKITNKRIDQIDIEPKTLISLELKNEEMKQRLRKSLKELKAFISYDSKDQ